MGKGKNLKENSEKIFREIIHGKSKKNQKIILQNIQRDNLWEKAKH